MKNILLVGAAENKPTDGMINLGVQKILTTKYGECNFDYINNDLDELPTVFATTNYDLIVQCGGPWLWHYFWNTPKKKNFDKIIEAHPEAKVIFLGIGACMNINRMNTNFMMDEKHRKNIQAFFSKANLITVREPLAKEILDNAGIECTLLSCPAFYVEYRNYQQMDQ